MKLSSSFGLGDIVWTGIMLSSLMAVLLTVLLVVGLPIAYVASGCGSFGPTKVHDVTVTRLYVDAGGDYSAYMVGTDKGVFEVDNGVFLGLWNADELYAVLKEGRRYRITTKGNKVLGFWLQQYPYITKIQEAHRQPTFTPEPE